MALIFFMGYCCSISYADESQYSVEVVSVELPETLQSSHKVQANLTVTNTGSKVISSKDNIFASYHLYDSHNNLILFDGLRSELSEDIYPGETKTIPLQIETPGQPGEYILEVDFVQEQVQWFSDISKSFVKRAEIYVDNLYNADIVMKSNLKRMFKAREKNVTVVIQNTGKAVWKAKGDILLSYHWLNENHEVVIWDGIRTELSQDVHPGDIVQVKAKIGSPGQPGTYYLKWDMVKEGDFWLFNVNPESVAEYEVQVQYSWDKIVWMFFFIFLLLILFRLIRTKKR